MDDRALKERTLQFGLAVIRLASSLPKSRETDVVARQIIRSATSVGANYRSACRARSKPDFISQIGLVEQEADETLYWLEVLVGAEMIPRPRAEELVSEAKELLAIFTAAGRTAKASIRNSQSAIRNSRRTQTPEESAIIRGVSRSVGT